MSTWYIALHTGRKCLAFKGSPSTRHHTHTPGLGRGGEGTRCRFLAGMPTRTAQRRAKQEGFGWKCLRP
eukprot:10934220-Alexandrium_andersonii.AAC.1